LTVRDVERAFLRTGAPFSAKQGADAGRSVPAAAPDADQVAGSPKQARTRAGRPQRRRAALATWVSSNHRVIAAQIRNVVVLAATAGDAVATRRVEAAIAALRR
jgi:hypothetical protein